MRLAPQLCDCGAKFLRLSEIGARCCIQGWRSYYLGAVARSYGISRGNQNSPVDRQGPLEDGVDALFGVHRRRSAALTLQRVLVGRKSTHKGQSGLSKAAIPWVEVCGARVN